MSATYSTEKSRENEMRNFFGNIKQAKERERMKTNWVVLVDKCMYIGVDIAEHFYLVWVTQRMTVRRRFWKKALIGLSHAV